MPRPLSARLRLLVTGLLISGSGLLGLASAVRAQGDDASRFFESEIRPLLTEKCVSCHGPEKQKGKLRLDGLAHALAGGASGPAVVPGDLEQSLLVEAVRYEGLEMPPSGPLTPEEADALVKWVEIGAPWPGPGGETDAAGAETRAHGFPFTPEDREYWAFQPVRDPEPPAVDHPTWGENPIDRFLLDRMARDGLTPAPRADRRTLIRRLSFDLHGLPPTPEEIEAFENDPDPAAYEKLVDRMLASPRYGERWARHWLDLVRYAESNGYRADEYRPHAWRYRDYVIDSFHEDKPYDQFVREQIAGDELDPTDPVGRVATGFLRLWIYESNQRDVEGQWETILADVTDVTSDVFLGLGMQCARCHDHKYDPILQKDYFRLQAFFAPIRPRDDLGLIADQPILGTDERQVAWDLATADIRKRIETLIADKAANATEGAVTKFQPHMQAMLARPVETLSPQERQLCELAYRQVQMELDKIGGSLKGESKTKYDQLQAELARFVSLKPDFGPPVETVSDVGTEAPSTYIPGDRSQTPVEPGFLSILDPEPAPIPAPEGWQDSTGRRAVLARWMTDPSNPFVARVLVNRVWQYHHGRGLVESASDFGRLGEPPTHPELLDWLASRFVEDGWSLKSLHRRILLSESYRQSAHHPDAAQALQIDPLNRLLWHRPIQRAEAEVIRDSLLAVSGELDTKEGGPSVDSKEPRRSVYMKVYRNKRDPLLELFDGPDGYFSLSVRNVTITPTQSLMMINGDWVLDRARAFARRLLETSNETNAVRIVRAYRLALGRDPSEDEREDALAFLADQTRVLEPSALAALPDECEMATAPFAFEAWVDFAHALLNANEFLYID